MTDEREYAVAHRLLDLVERVDRGGSLTIAVIMDHCNVERAAAGRYLDFVKARRDLQCDKRNGEHFWSRSVGKPATADLDEVVALELGLESARWLQGTPYFTLFERRIDELRNTADPAAADLLHRFVQSFHHRTQGDGTYRTKHQQIRDLLHAIRDRRTCRIRYQPHLKEEQEYDIHPILLVLYKDRLYLLARKIEDETVERRTFVLESVSEVQVQHDAEPFPVPSPRELDPSHTFQHSFGIYTDIDPPPEPVVLEVKGTAAMALRRHKLHPSQERAEGADGWLRVSWHVAICPELRAYILSLLPDVRVVAPETLREELRAMVATAFL